MLQEAVDASLITMRGVETVTASTGQKRQLRSLADILKGKQGRFRQNLSGNAWTTRRGHRRRPETEY